MFLNALTPPPPPPPHTQKNKKICDNSVDTYPSTIKFASECFMAQEMCDKAVNRCFLYFILFLTNMKIKKYVTVLFSLRYNPGQYKTQHKTQQMCGKAVWLSNCIK